MCNFAVQHKHQYLTVNPNSDSLYSGTMKPKNLLVATRLPRIISGRRRTFKININLTSAQSIIWRFNDRINNRWPNILAHYIIITKAPNVMIALQRIIFNILNVCTVPRIMFRAPHIMFEAPHITFEAPHIMFEAPHIMFEAPHIMIKALHIMIKAPHIMLEAPHIMLDAQHIMFKTPHIMFKTLHIIFEPPHIMIKSPNEMTFDHLRQLWLSILDYSECILARSSLRSS